MTIRRHMQDETARGPLTIPRFAHRTIQSAHARRETTNLQGELADEADLRHQARADPPFMILPWYLLLPLAAAVIYAVASMFLKKALSEGVHPMACFHINNWAASLVFVPLALFEKGPVQWHLAWVPVGVGFMFFFGGWFTFIAMTRGDVSLVTPVLGSKVVFVAMASSLLIADRLPMVMWLAAIITTAGIFLMSATDLKTPRGARLAGPVVMALISSAFFAFSDVVLQRWAPQLGGKMFLAIMSATTGTLSALVISLLPSAPPMQWNAAMKWSVGGSVLTALQSLLVGLALAFYQDAMGVTKA